MFSIPVIQTGKHKNKQKIVGTEGVKVSIRYQQLISLRASAS